MNRRHIVLVSQIPLWSMGKATGGPAFQNTLRALGEQYRVSLVTPRLGYVEHGDLPPSVELHEFRHRFHGLFRQVRKLGWATDTLGWYTFRRDAWPIVERLCAAGDVDLVYGYEIYGVPVARRAADRFGLPMVARYQGSLMSWRRKERLASVRYLKHLSALKTPADLYVMTDDGTLGDQLLRDLRHPADRIFFAMNGVDRAIREAPVANVRTRLGIDAGVPLLLTVSRLMNWKRVDRAIRAVGELARSGSSAHLVIIGVGPLEGQLRELAVAEGIAEHTHFLGGVARDELANHYRAATLLLSLYDYSNLGNPVIEAMLLGCPPFALDVGGTSRLVHDGVNGVLLPDPDPAAIARDVERHLADRASLVDLGVRAAAWADENLWTWDKRMAAEIERLDQVMMGGAHH